LSFYIRNGQVECGAPDRVGHIGAGGSARGKK